MARKYFSATSRAAGSTCVPLPVGPGPSGFAVGVSPLGPLVVGVSTLFEGSVDGVLGGIVGDIEVGVWRVGGNLATKGGRPSFGVLGLNGPTSPGFGGDWKKALLVPQSAKLQK